MLNKAKPVIAKKNIFILAASLFILSSCEKVIDLELDDNSSKVVIEGNITNQAGPYFVKVTKSVNFTETNNYPAITNAIVVVTDNIGQRDTLTYASNGAYKTNTLQGIAGRTYNLSVLAEGKTYTAASTMPLKVALDTLKPLSITFGGFTNTEVIPVFTDPIALGNNYQFLLYRNKLLDKTYNVTNDNVNNGLQNQRPLLSNDFDYEVGDTATVEMRCIDPVVYNYYFTLAQMASNGPGGGTTPSNPPNNISNGALGIFSAHTTETKSIKMP
jgi:Domain of unknown function (DUF4249)